MMKKLISGHYTTLTYPTPCALTFGNFDGVHLGHQALFAALKKQADARHLPLVVLTFEPPTRIFFKQSETRLNPLRDKVRFLLKAGVDTVCCVRFDRAFSRLDAALFIKSLLLTQLQAKYILVGEDARFGYQHLGTTAQLIEIAKTMHTEVDIFPAYKIADSRISSTCIREAMQSAALDKVALFLGRPYSVVGRLVKGQGLGSSKLGIPTANIHVTDKHPPLSGVFAVKLTLPSGALLEGVANWGVRPTVDGKKRVLEVHAFEWQPLAYREWIEVHFFKKIREECAFRSLDELKKQIQCDIVAAENFFGEVSR